MFWNSANSDQDILEVQNVVLESIPPFYGVYRSLNIDF